MSLYFEYQHLAVYLYRAMKRWGWGGGMNSTSGVTSSRYRWPFTVRIRCRHQLDNGCPVGWGKPGAAGEDDRAISRWALKQGTCKRNNQGTLTCQTKKFGEVKDRTRMRKKGFFSFLSCLFLCRFKRAQGNEYIYTLLIYLFLRCRIETQWTKNLCNLLAMNGLYWDIDCTVCLPWWNRSGGNC